VKKLARYIGLDRTIAFTLLARSWSMIAGAVNIILISRHLSPAEQGYFYTFASLVAVQIVFELGFSYVISQLASHDRIRLKKFDNEGIEGDPVAHSRLASIFQKTVRWYSKIGIVMGVGLLFIGTYFFYSHPKPGEQIHWFWPWCLDVVAATFAFVVDPAVSFLEGSGWVAQVAKLRFPQALLGSLLGWSCLLLHKGLFAPGMMIAGQAIVALYFVGRVHRELLLRLWRHNVGEFGISWRVEIWPFQWRVALSWASSYFIVQFFNPILFAYTGPVAAGQMGMSLTICTSLASLAQSWVNTKAPRFGSLVAMQRIATLEEEFWRVTLQSTLILVLAELTVIAGIAFLGHQWPQLVVRVVGVPIFSLLLLAVLLSHLVICESYYLRAHKTEPFALLWVVIATFSILTVTWGAKHYGVLGATIAYLLSAGFLRLIAGTYVFLRMRSEWHGPAIALQEEAE